MTGGHFHLTSIRILKENVEITVENIFGSNLFLPISNLGAMSKIRSNSFRKKTISQQISERTGANFEQSSILSKKC